MDINHIDRCLDCMQDKAGAQVCPHCGWDEGAASRPPPYLPYGTLLDGQYVVGRILGHGGFGVTYLAWDTRLETRVALKEYLPRDFGTRASDGLSVSCFQGEAMEMFAYGKAKFLEEARTLARFNDHPGIVSVLNFFEANSTAYMVMQYLDGMDLKQYLGRVGGRLPVDVAIGIMTPVFDALRAVHEGGLLHRDMSPDNIYVTDNQRILILDFGAARDAMGSHSRSLALIRKPGYSPEEQYRLKGQQGPWTDVYAAGATLYRIITGEAPPEALDRLAEDQLQPPSRLGVAIDPQREAALMKALAVRAPDRFQGIREFQDALVGPPVEVSPTPPPQPQPAQPRPSAPPASAARRSAAWIWVPVLLVGIALGVWAIVANLPSNVTDPIVPPPLISGTGPSSSADDQADRDRQEEERRRQRLQEQTLLEARRVAEQRRRQQEEADRSRRAAAAREAEEARRAAAEREAEAARREAARQAAARRIAEADASRCRGGYLNATQIRALVTNRTAYGQRIDVSSPYGWKEYQGSSGRAYFQKDGKGYVSGYWKMEGDNICWCYGNCTEYQCKRVWANGDCSEFYYEEPGTGKRTGRVYRWEQGDKTG